MLGEMVETKQVFNFVEQHLTLCGADAFHLQQQFSQAASKFDEQVEGGGGAQRRITVGQFSMNLRSSALQ